MEGERLLPARAALHRRVLEPLSRIRFRRRNYRKPGCASRGKIFLFISRNRVVPEETRYNITREIRVSATDFSRRQSEKKKEKCCGGARDETERSARAKFICIGPPSLFRAEIQLIGFSGITTRVRVQARFF